ncbi:hypothetical protein CA267_012235 [Alteromonas pelagimontana]|uniref:Uncharacterized protein n=1 Tax=Alteromonas pelagimontana TaxID=1858656 RepID=A0A6M4MFV1_9ALTE|nr:hypothetical protein [Alteromonas pelagimontana]QJR81495.1 hypothetical protein CA267_012235 [Alteromonas pelagimontana]
MIRYLSRFMVAFFILLLSMPTHAQDTLVATLFGEDIRLSDISPSDAQLNEMAKMNSASKDMALAQFRHGRLAETILKKITEDYASKQNLEIDSELVEKFKEKFGPELAASRKESDERKENVGEKVPQKSIDDIATEQVRHWQVNKALYENFGGTVIFQQSDPQFPVQAYETLLKRYQKEGKFEILNDRYSAVFWEAFEPPFSFQLSADQVDFSDPWWLTE